MAKEKEGTEIVEGLRRTRCRQSLIQDAATGDKTRVLQYTSSTPASKDADLPRILPRRNRRAFVDTRQKGTLRQVVAILPLPRKDIAVAVQSLYPLLHRRRDTHGDIVRRKRSAVAAADPLMRNARRVVSDGIAIVRNS